jgi:kynurenine formamidase
MCSPWVMEKVKTAARPTVSRRGFLGMLGAAAVTGAFAPVGCATAQTQPTRSVFGSGFAVQDLTHTVSPEFPVFPGFTPMEITTEFTIGTNSSNGNRLTLSEHVGTHLDAPFHWAADGLTADKIPVEQFFAPLAVVDISERASRNDDARVTVDDIRAWEEQHGELPAGAFVAMYSGWERRLSDPETYVNLDSSGTPHWPGFGPEAAEFLVAERDIVGIGVDTLSLDTGATQDFGVHLTVLPAGKYGLENLANLGEASPTGATIIVGGPKHEGATGGPARIFAVSNDG